MQKTVKVVAVESAKAGKTDRIVFHYTDLNGGSYTPGTPDKIGALAVKLDPDSLKVFTSLKDKATDKKQTTGGWYYSGLSDVITIEMVKDDKYWNLTKASTASASNSGSSTQQQQPAKKPFDDVGVKVGASRNQAIAILGSFKSGGKGTLVEYLNEVDALSYEIVVRQAAQEDNVRAGTNPATTPIKSATDSFVDVDDFFNAP